MRNRVSRLSVLSRLSMALAAAGLSMGANAFVVNESFSGNYAEPSENGLPGEDQRRGVIIDVVENSIQQDFSNGVLVQWFTYRDGEPLWLISDLHAIDINTQTAELTLFETSGGGFAPGDIGDPQLTPWGTGTLKFDSCRQVTLEVDGIDGTESFEMINLTQQPSCEVVREFEQCPSFATAAAQPGFCILEGDITSDVTLTNETNWLLQGKVSVRDGASLTIEPGTEIIGGTSGSIDFLNIDAGAKIFAEGAQSAPIVMRGFDSRIRGEWGGLVISGNAPINGCPEGTDLCLADGEGDTGPFGGNDPMDSSGIVRYVVVANGGNEFTPTNELNGIALQGVGAGTVFEFVQSHLGADDAMEPFGGTVNMRNLVLTGDGDDSFDWVLGYQGNVQYVVIKKYNDSADRGIESDNLNADNDSLPRSNPTLANFTIIGSSVASQGVLHRRGTAGQMANFIITGFGDGCVDIDNDATWAQAQAGDLLYRNSVAGDCAGGTFEDDGDGFDLAGWWTDAGNLDANPMLGGPKGIRPMPGSPAIGIGAVPFENTFFEQVDFAGAINPNGPDWTQGWTVGLDRDAPYEQ